MKIICKEKILPLIIQHHFASTAYAHSRKPEIFYCQTAFVDGLQAIFQFAEIGIDIVCPKGELDSTLFRFADDVEAWNFVACVDFECNVMFFQYIQDAVDTLIGPVFGILCIQLFRQEGRIGIDVGRLIGKDLDGLVHQVIHILFFGNTVVVYLFGAVYP